jgi:parvulin-like peptidyl-prolyl isomerase
MVRTSHIFVAFGDDKAASKARAEEAQKKAADPGKLEDREHFKALVAEYSDDDETKRTGGDLRYLSAAEIEERFGTAAKDAVWAGEKINDVTGVVEGKNGWHVFKRTGRRKPIERGLEQVRNQIRNVLYREKRTEAFQTFVDGLQKELGVETFPERLEQVTVQPGPAPTPGMPGGPGAPHGHGGAPAPGGAGADGDPH